MVIYPNTTVMMIHEDLEAKCDPHASMPGKSVSLASDCIRGITSDACPSHPVPERHLELVDAITMKLSSAVVLAVAVALAATPHVAARCCGKWANDQPLCTSKAQQGNAQACEWSDKRCAWSDGLCASEIEVRRRIQTAGTEHAGTVAVADTCILCRSAMLVAHRT